MAEMIVLVPGIGLGGMELTFLARRLRKQGYRVKIFWKNPWRVRLASSAEALHQMLTAQQGETPYLVAHSLGGLVTLQMLHDYPQQRVGRIVMLGSPLTGCLAARRALRIPGGPWIIGQALGSVCTQPDLTIPDGCEVGSIAGRINLLLGLALCPHKPNDTLVCIEETQPPGLSAHCILPVTHTSMLFSKQVSEQIISFLRQGDFST